MEKKIKYQNKNNSRQIENKIQNFLKYQRKVNK